MKRVFFELTKKAVAVATAAINMLGNHEAMAKQNFEAIVGDLATSPGLFRNKLLRPKLTLRLNINDPTKSLLAYHSSHSSHSSHASHASHSSHSSGGIQQFVKRWGRKRSGAFGNRRPSRLRNLQGNPEKMIK